VKYFTEIFRSKSCGGKEESRRLYKEELRGSFGSLHSVIIKKPLKLLWAGNGAVMEEILGEGKVAWDTGKETGGYTHVVRVPVGGVLLMKN
jgi:hypothetical protein